MNDVEGWAFLNPEAKRQHYFRGRRSLCGNQLAPHGLRVAGNLEELHGDECRNCRTVGDREVATWRAENPGEDYAEQHDNGRVRTLGDVHVIEAGKFVCRADRTDYCHEYPPCSCEHWSDEHAKDHPAVQNERCWLDGWLNGVGLTDTYNHPDWEDRERSDFPDGPIEYEYDGDGLVWWYVDDEGNE